MNRILPTLYGIVALGVLLTFLSIYHHWGTRSYRLPSPPHSSSSGGSKSSSRTNLGEVTIAGSHLKGWTEEGKPLWELWAGKIEVSEKERLIRLHEARGHYYEGGRTVSSFEAGVIEVELTDRRKILSMSNNVCARWASRDVMVRSPSLVWDFGSKQIEGRQGVEFARGRWKLTGQQFLADLSMKRAQVVGAARLVRTG